MLVVQSEAQFNECLAEYSHSFHCEYFQSEVRISIQQLDRLTYRCESYLHIVDKLVKTDGTRADDTDTY